ncbi:hypothetical protein GCM10009868_36700 [Terrabacter aerolatus]|uniref:Integral membrane protein n=1 Tax=Terrabacter aerolatus TaxID=422442 RepID=A0A512CVX4_9MICO|nr:hypothetical protein [Terrabacter aerolatus]GEO28347.1 hypothetical protein TAE01_01570 [Terrabacter aerolatus]
MARQASGGGGRSVLSAICGLLAIVLLPVSLVGFWASVLLTRTDVFVQELQPVVSKPQVQEALADGIVKGVLSAVRLQPAIEKALEAPIRAEATKLVASPQVATAWTSAIRSVHTQFIAVMQGRGSTELDDQGRVAMRVTIPIPALTSVLQQAGVPDAGSIAPVVAIPLVKATDLQKAQTAYRIADAWGPWGPLVVAALALLSIALARRWRAAATLVALGWIVTALALALVLMVSREPLMRRVDPAVARTIADAAYGLAARNLYYEVAIAVGVGLLMLVVSAVSLAFGRRRRS